jgi:CRP-like cAMP-binding protein
MLLSKEHLEQFLRSLPFFKGMDDSDIAHYLRKSHIKEYKKHQSIFIHGDQADRFFIIIGGWIKLHRETPDGEEAVNAVLTRGDIFGEAAIFCEEKYPFSAHCVEPCKVIETPTSFLTDQSKDNQYIMARIIKSLCHQTKKLQLENEHMALLSSPQRVGCLLLQLSSDMQGKGGTFTFPYDKSLAAMRLGMKAETFSRSLTQLKPLGVEVKGAEITINSFEKLINYSCSHCSALPGECKKSGNYILILVSKTLAQHKAKTR